MLQELARRLQNVPDGSLTWVDLGGGTGVRRRTHTTWTQPHSHPLQENVQMMSEYLPLSKFKQIYVVDLCKALCEVAQAKVDAKGWTNVRVVEADACTFKPDESRVSLVTFSYSLSSTRRGFDTTRSLTQAPTVIPPFLTAVDNARSFLSPDGLLGVCDFYTAQKYEDKPVKMSWARRFFWRATFDIDGIDVGPERRMYLHHVLSTVHENTSQGSIPYVPWLRAPFYVFVGKAGV